MTERLPPRALAAVLAGVAVLAVAWLGPLPGWAPTSFTAHMTMHVAVVAVAAPLLALGLGGSRADPVRRWPGWFPPLPLSLVELAVVWGWHAPALHHASRHSAAVMALEQLLFLASALAVWLAAFGGPRDQRARRVVPGIGALLMTSTHMTLLGVLLAGAPRPLFGTHGATPAAALADQHLGGVVMLTVAGLSYLVGGLWLLLVLLRRPRVTAPGT